MHSEKLRRIIIDGELVIGWNGEDSGPQSQAEWKQNISDLYFRLQLGSRLALPEKNETYKVTTMGYSLTDAGRMIIFNALSRYLKPRKIKCEDIIFRQQRDGALFTKFEIVSKLRPQTAVPQTGDLFGG